MIQVLFFFAEKAILDNKGKNPNSILKRLYRVLYTKTNKQTVEPVCAREFSKKYLVISSHAVQKLQHNVITDEEIQRWRAVKHLGTMQGDIVLYINMCVAAGTIAEDDTLEGFTSVQRGYMTLPLGPRGNGEKIEIKK